MAQQEGRIQLALQAYNRGQFRSLTCAARAYNVTYATLYRRRKGTLSRSQTTPHNQKLTSIEENTLVEWILSMDTRGMPPTRARIQEMAVLLLKDRVEHVSVCIGKLWVHNFVKRHTVLKMQCNRKYDYQRARCEDPEVIRAWFRLVHNIIAKYGILEEDIYKFDETGFRMGVISACKVVTAADKRRVVSIQPGNREWTTTIECIRSTGEALPPLVIFKGQMLQKAWYDNIPDDWKIGVGESGFTTDEIGLHWIKEHFDQHTKACVAGKYRLLVLDGHGSHITAEFDQYCTETLIRVLCMPPHSSHLLQHLDISCFSVLKRSYESLVQEQIRLGIMHITKDNFLDLYIPARKASFTSTVRNGFKAAGISPFGPDRVLDRLHVQLRTPSPPPVSTITPELYVPETPKNSAQLELDKEAAQGLIRHSIQSPPTPTVKTVKQLIKGCELAMHRATLLTAENAKLRVANERVKQKRNKKKKFVRQGGILSAIEVREAHTGSSNRKEANDGPSEPTQSRAPRMCSLCRSNTHTARTCDERQEIN